MDTFAMEPSSTRIAVWCIVFLAALLLVSAIFVAQSPTITVTKNSLLIRKTLFGREIPATAVEFGQVKVVDLGATPEIAPKWRLNGIGLFRYRVGWFRLRNNQRALAFLGRDQRVVYIPTSLGYVVMFDSHEPDRLYSSIMNIRRL